MIDRRKYPNLGPINNGNPVTMDREALLGIYGRPISVPGIEGGTIALMDVMGNDQAIVQSARTSYGREASTHKRGIGKPAQCEVCGITLYDDVNPHCAEGDRRLIRYLVSHRHTTPIEACEIKLHVKLPIFVERQWARHRTASWNEMSGRYITLDQGFYVPTEERMKLGQQSTSNKQGSQEADWSEETIDRLRQDFVDEQDAIEREYHANMNNGMAKELARINMPVSAFTVKVWKIDLHNLIHFLGLRLDPHAQWEIRQYAEVIARIVRDWCPLLWEAVYDYRLEAAHFSRMELSALREIVRLHRDNFWIPVRDVDNPGDDQKGGANERKWWIDLLEKYGVESKRDRADFLRKLGVIE